MKRNNPGVELILSYVDKFGIVDKDRPGLKQNGIVLTHKGRNKPRRSIDLHGMTQEQAATKVRAEVQNCARSGGGRLLVIHGYGLHSSPEQTGGILKKMVRDMLDGELKGMIKTWRPAAPRDGAEGATIVEVRSSKSAI